QDLRVEQTADPRASAGAHAKPRCRCRRRANLDRTGDARVRSRLRGAHAAQVVSTGRIGSAILLCPFTPYTPSRRRQPLLEIGDDVLLVLEADREADDVGSGASLDFLRVGELTMSGRGRMNDERTR